MSHTVVCDANLDRDLESGHLHSNVPDLMVLDKAFNYKNVRPYERHPCSLPTVLYHQKHHPDVLQSCAMYSIYVCTFVDS